MRPGILLIVAATASCAIAQQQQQQQSTTEENREEPKYTTRYDDIDLDEILNNKRLYRKYFECLMGSRCTPEGREVRDAIPEALATNCRKCSEKQVLGANKVIQFLREKKPEDFKELRRIYDPNGIYVARAGYNVTD